MGLKCNFWNDVIWRTDRENRCRGLGCRLKEGPKK